MSKSIYDQALEYLSILVEQANARKLSNDIVVNRWGIERIRKVISNAQKQEKLINKIKEIIDRQDDSYISSMLEESKKYYEIKVLIGGLEK